jgi:two-component system sensor histidine kinase YesM
VIKYNGVRQNIYANSCLAYQIERQRLKKLAEWRISLNLLYKAKAMSILKLIHFRQNPKRPTSIRYRMTFYNTLLICALIIVIVSINLIITTRILKKNIGNFGSQSVTNTSDKIDSAMQKFEIASRIINNNTHIQQELLDINNFGFPYSEGTLEYDNRRLSFSQPVTDIMNVIGDIQSVGIYFSKDRGFYYGAINEKQLSSGTQIAVYGTFEKLDSSKKPFLWSTGNTVDDTTVFSISRTLINTTNFEHLGYEVVNIDSSYLSDILNDNSEGDVSSYLVIDQNGYIISSTSIPSDDGVSAAALNAQTVKKITHSNSGYFMTNVNGKSMILAYCTSNYTGWKVAALIPLDAMNRQVIQNQFILIFVGVIGLLVSVLISLVIASMITRPIRKLKLVMRNAEQGDFDVTYSDNTFIETKALGEGFVRMMRNLKGLMQKVYDEELRKKDAEFKSLQAQINPHFLYNTFETINYMLILDGKYELSKIIVYLGDILRYSISGEKRAIMLEEDIEQIKKYLYIQKMRFGDRLNFEFDISEQTKDCLILKLLIQPIVENAITHGIAKKKDGGTVKISSVMEENGMLLVRVSDNGIGIDPEKLGTILNEGKAEGNENHFHLGINNVNTRIKLFYGDDYGVSIESTVGSGTCVSLRLPETRRKRNDDETSDR